MSQKYASSGPIEQRCQRCDVTDSVLVSLRCHHNFCLVCISFVAIKCRANGSSDGQVECPVCQEITLLDQESNDAIRSTIEQTLIPKLNSYREPIQQVSAENANEQQNDQRTHLRDKKEDKAAKRYSEEPSYDHITPSTKYFFSKCDSPVNGNIGSNLRNREWCESHPTEQLTFVCVTCRNQLLCLKCLGGKHRKHDIKNFRKGIELAGQQISVKKLELNERLEKYEMLERRMEKLRQDVNGKWEKTKQQIGDAFYQLVSKLKRREAELLQICNEHYNSLELSLSRELEALKQHLSCLHGFMADIRTLTRTGYSTNQTERSEKPTDFFAMYNRVKEALDEHFTQNVQPEVPLSLSTSADTMLWLSDRQVIPVCQSIAKINLTFGQACVALSTKKLHTKFTSLNSSREKKKKYVKTEQDEMFQCGLKRKTQHNIESSDKMSRKGSNKKALPKYVTTFLENQQLMRQSHKLLDNSLMDEFDSAPKLNGSKTSSKLLSRSIVPTESAHKKKKEPQKDKQRVERKTTNPLQSLKNQKNLFDTKRKKVH